MILGISSNGRKKRLAGSWATLRHFGKNRAFGGETDSSDGSS